MILSILPPPVGQVEFVEVRRLLSHIPQDLSLYHIWTSERTLGLIGLLAIAANKKWSVDIFDYVISNLDKL